MNQTVFAIGQIRFSGTDAPLSWYRHITSRGRSHPLAIDILKEIVWWYRPQEIYDDRGNLVRWEKKFAADMLHHSYAELANRFNVSKKQIRTAICLLKDLGLLTTKVAARVVTKNREGAGQCPLYGAHPRPNRQHYGM
jgi:hypothetical protein